MLWQAPPVRLLTSNSDQSKAWRLGGGTGLFSTHKLTVRAVRVACSGNMTALNCHWLHETATEAGGGVAPVCQSGLQSLKSFHFNYLLQLMIQDMMSSRLYMCFSIKDRCANMQTNDMKEDTGDSNSGDEYMHTSAAAVCMWQCFQCGEHESHMSIEPHIYITILSISLSAIYRIAGSIDVVTPLTSSPCTSSHIQFW